MRFLKNLLAQNAPTAQKVGGQGVLPAERERELWDGISTRSLQLIILPTESCNFRCEYCYETFKLGKMQPDIVSAIKEHLTRRLPELATLHLSWFGGEPLLARDIIEDISRHVISLVSSRQGCVYFADMTTNAYLLTPDIFRGLCQLGVTTYQISFDGTQAEHDRRRHLADGGPTFERIWENLVGISRLDGQFRVMARLHLDANNVASIPDFIGEYARCFRNDSRFRLFIRPVSRLGGVEDARIPVLESSNGLQMAEQFRLDCERQGVSSEAMAQDASAPICYAARLNSWVIRSDGRISKCTTALDHESNSVGRILHDGAFSLSRKNLLPWIRGADSRILGELRCPLEGFPSRKCMPADTDTIASSQRSKRGISRRSAAAVLTLLWLYGAATLSFATSPHASPASYEKYLLSEQDFTKDSPENLSQEQVLADFTALEKLLKRAYSGYDYFEEQGADWEALFVEYRQKLRDRREWSLDAFFSLLMSLFRDARIVDGHMYLAAHSPSTNLVGRPGRKPWTARFADFYVRQSAGKFFLAPRVSTMPALGSELLSVDGQVPDKFLFPTHVPRLEGQAFLLGSFGEKPQNELHCRIAGKDEPLVLPLHVSRMGNFDSERPILRYETVEGVTVVAIRSMEPQYAKELERFVATAEKVRNQPAVILDLRGIPGGGLGHGLRWLGKLTNETFRLRYKVAELLSPEVYAGEINSLRDDLRKTEEEKGRQYLLKYIEQAAQRLDQAQRAPPATRWGEAKTYSYTGEAPQRFPGALIVLSDKRNASSGESFADAARSLPNAIIMGENSSGANTFCPTRMYHLPNSNIEITMGEAIKAWEAGTMEGKGLVPDIWVDEVDAMPVALDYVKTILRKSHRESTNARQHGQDRTKSNTR